MQFSRKSARNCKSNRIIQSIFIEAEIFFQHNEMYESLVHASVLAECSKETYFLKMLMLRSQKNIKMMDYGFFNMSMHDFKNVSI